MPQQPGRDPRAPPAVGFMARLQADAPGCSNGCRMPCARHNSTPAQPLLQVYMLQHPSQQLQGQLGGLPGPVVHFFKHRVWLHGLFCLCLGVLQQQQQLPQQQHNTLHKPAGMRSAFSYLKNHCTLLRTTQQSDSASGSVGDDDLIGANKVSSSAVCGRCYQTLVAPVIRTLLYHPAACINHIQVVSVDGF